jgi:hypothetical protein
MISSDELTVPTKSYITEKELTIVHPLLLLYIWLYSTQDNYTKHTTPLEAGPPRLKEKEFNQDGENLQSGPGNPVEACKTTTINTEKGMGWGKLRTSVSFVESGRSMRCFLA